MAETATLNAKRAIFELFFEYIQHYGNSIAAHALVRLTSELGVSENATRAALCRLTQQGWLRREVIDRQSFYAMTAVGWERLEEVRPRIFADRGKAWDGFWTILTFSTPERLRQHRDHLRRELMFLGYGALTSTTWINPNPITDVTLRHLALRKLDCHIHLFRSRQVSSQPHSMIVDQCYNLAAVQQRYRKFLSKWLPLSRDYQAKFAIGKPPAKNICFATKMRLLHEYGDFLYDDPFLPTELLPDPWIGAEAWSVFRDLYFFLAEPAVEFFSLTFEGPSTTLEEQQAGKQRTLETNFVSQ